MHREPFDGLPVSDPVRVGMPRKPATVRPGMAPTWRELVKAWPRFLAGISLWVALFGVLIWWIG